MYEVIRLIDGSSKLTMCICEFYWQAQAIQEGLMKRRAEKFDPNATHIVYIVEGEEE
jgi:hypothetical protein